MSSISQTLKQSRNRMPIQLKIWYGLFTAIMSFFALRIAEYAGMRLPEFVYRFLAWEQVGPIVTLVLLPCAVAVFLLANESMFRFAARTRNVMKSERPFNASLTVFLTALCFLVYSGILCLCLGPSEFIGTVTIVSVVFIFLSIMLGTACALDG